jgi:phosphatidylglycerol:prolipoprotein diacylglycerol transferase
MRPILFRIVGMGMTTSGFFFWLSCLVGLIIGWKAGKRIGFSNVENVAFFCGAVLFAYIAGNGNAWLFAWLDSSGNSGLRSIFSSGFVSFGAIWGALGFGALFSFIRQRLTFKLLDWLAALLPLVESIYRIGCLLTGCCYGKVIDGWGGVYLPDIYGNWQIRYPTQILYMVFTFTLFLWLWRKIKQSSIPGVITISFLATYAIGRFLLDFLRADLPSIGFLSYHQVTAMLSLMIAIIMYLFLHRGKKSAKFLN